MQFTYAPGATPIDADEAIALLPLHITTQSELNEWEQANILQAEKVIKTLAFCGNKSRYNYSYYSTI